MQDLPVTNPETAEHAVPPRIDFGALTSAYLDTVASIRRGENPQENYEAATQLATLLRNYADVTANLRALMALAILETEDINLRKLAEVMNVSKQRASQLVLTGRRIKREWELESRVF